MRRYSAQRVRQKAVESANSGGNMNWNIAEFEAAFGTAEQLPASDMPEICFSGRSNVGKSSLINRLLNRKSMARVSSTPGKTVTINFYRLDAARLVDLPGYGYAKVADSERERWGELMESYFRTGRNIRLCLQLVDMRHKIGEQDLSMLEFLDYYKVPHLLVTTKCDKLNKSEFSARLQAISDEIGNKDIKVIPFSALKGIGVAELREAIEENLI